VKQAVEEATERTLIKFSDDCLVYYWIVKLVIKLAVSVCCFFKKKQIILFSLGEMKITEMYGHLPLKTLFFSPVILF